LARKDHAKLPGIETARLRPFTLDGLEREAPPYKNQDVLYYEPSPSKQPTASNA